MGSSSAPSRQCSEFLTAPLKLNFTTAPFRQGLRPLQQQFLNRTKFRFQSYHNISQSESHVNLTLNIPTSHIAKSPTANMSDPEEDWISCAPHDDGTSGARFHFDISLSKALEFAKQCFRVYCVDPSVVKDYEELRSNKDLLEANLGHWRDDLILQTIQNKDPSWFVFEINNKDPEHRKWAALSYEIDFWYLLRDATFREEKFLIIVTTARVRELRHRIKSSR